MIFSRCSFVLCAIFAAMFLSPLALAQTRPPASLPGTRVPGLIKATNVVGDVRKVNPDKSVVKLENNMTLVEQNGVITGPDSSVILVFANGSTVKVGRDSRLEIRQFVMDPLETELNNIATLTSEPTASNTDLRLEFGEIVGNVKTLNRAQQATFSVSTPAGAAGIRGTTFRIVYRPTGTGQAFNYTLSTSEGVVLFEGTTTSGALASLDVPTNQEVVVVAQVDPATNSVVISAPTTTGGGAIQTQPISGAAASELQTASVQIIQTQQQTTFTTVEFQRAQVQVNQYQQQQPLNTPIPPPPQQPRLTPGDGQP